MRFENWDAIIFPQESHVPVQEFKTACYNTNDSRTCLAHYSLLNILH
jgi:hypothetical protein